METIYSKKDHQEINTSVLFKSSEFKESVMKESAEKFALISQTTRYMPQIVLNGNSTNIISFFDKMKELYFSERSIKNITDMSSRSSFFNTEAQEFNLEVAEKEIKESVSNLIQEIELYREEMLSVEKKKQAESERGDFH